ncbi:MAG TPA: S8 family serine peptidase [Pseudonocardiaceae bacterium]
MSSMPRAWTRLLGTAATVLAAVGLLAAPATATPGAAAVPGKIEPAVTAALQAGGSTDFFVNFAERADLGPASKLTDWTARGQAVYDALRETADASQAAARRDLDAAGAAYTPYWIHNTILVKGAARATADALSALPNVVSIEAPKTYHIPTPAEGRTERAIQAVEWGVNAIKANQVWSTFGVRGEGIVVANIDTGVDWDHPALLSKYRGANPVNHNYNWVDPSNACGSPSLVPCDNNNHGTHTMGTMVGDDGGTNQIGVAPNAKWIAAKGCESSSCSQAALLGSGQWVVAPTDLTGANPRPDLRPHIVNNSWGGGGNNTWYLSTVNAWRAAGIFPAFSNGNSGPSCNTSGSPGDYAESYSSGAYDVNGAIASFSSRGAAGTRIKPNLAAPGVNVRSAINGGGYGAFSGTSMASPHTAGAVALMWSAAPTLIGDLAQTSTLLNQTAVDTSDLTCGGTAGNNNVWGEGKLDALNAVTQSPRGPTGILAGRVTNAGTGAGISGATVTLTGPVNRTVTTDATGNYSATLPIGSYTATAAAYAYNSQTATVTITTGATTTRNFALTPVPSGSIAGVVRDTAGVAVAGATVTVLNTPIPPATTSATGAYSFATVPHGTYQVSAVGGPCHATQTLTVTVDGTETLNFALAPRRDSFGYSCAHESSAYVQGTTALTLTGDDVSAAVTLPFAFRFYGTSYGTAHVSSNGNLNFLGAATTFSNSALPSAAVPNAAIYAFWDDLIIDASARVYTRTAGVAPNRSFLVEWRNMAFYGLTGPRVDFEIELYENGQIAMRYRNLDPAQAVELGGSATVGIENAAGTVALQYSSDAASLASGRSIRFRV